MTCFGNNDVKIYVNYDTEEVVSTEPYVKANGTYVYALSEMETLIKDE